VLLHYKGMKTGAMLPLAVERVRYVGEPIVAIAAESRAAADDAAALIDVEYEPLPAALSPDARARPGAPLIHPELGDKRHLRDAAHGRGRRSRAEHRARMGPHVHDRPSHRRAARAAQPDRRL
jgi:CO/xanthine dehydrogenase Mo-binding subunit